MTVEPVLKVHSVVKRFGEVDALRGVSVSVTAGEIVGLVGDNGAGKSTLVKAIAGVHEPDAGEISVGGQTARNYNPATAWRLGVGTVFQDLCLAGDVDVASNVFMGREVVRCKWLGPLALRAKRVMAARAEEALGRLGISIPVNSLAGELSGGQRQAIAVARMFISGRKVVLLDEPTAALSVQHRLMVDHAIRYLAQQGAAVLVVSHNFPELMQLAHRIVVMRHGQVVGSRMSGETSGEELVGLLTGAQGPDATVEGPVSA